MLIPAPHYEDFSDSLTLEELLLQLAMKIADIQKNSTLNTENASIITISSNINTENASITCNGWVGSWINGVLTVKNFFPNYDFTTGVGAYPLNRTNICDALFHVAVYQQKQELSTIKNPGKAQFIDWGLTTQTTIGAAYQTDISLNITDLPITITVEADQTIIKAKPYLS